MKCDYPGCTGSHTSNDWGNMCPVARQSKRARQAKWVYEKGCKDTSWYLKKTFNNYMGRLRSRIEEKTARLEENKHLGSYL